MPLGRAISKGLVYTIDLSKIADRENPRTVEAPIYGEVQEPTYIDWGDGSAPQVVTSGTWPTHTYAEGTGDVFTVTVRTATGHLPFIRFSPPSASVVGDYAIVKAVTAIDHFCGWAGNATVTQARMLANQCSNLTYVDPRFCGQARVSNLDRCFATGVNLEQPIESFCFDFCDASAIDTFAAIFSACRKIYGTIPAGMFDNNTATVSFANAFNGCINLTGKAYVFWKADGSLDTDKFPNLNNGNNAYYNCIGLNRAEIPTDYGGTMTVS